MLVEGREGRGEEEKELDLKNRMVKKEIVLGKERRKVKKQEERVMTVAGVEEIVIVLVDVALEESDEKRKEKN